MNVYYSSDNRRSQGVQLGFHTEASESMSFEAILNLLRTRRISFLGLTNTGLDDVAGEMLADALAVTPPRATNQVSSKPEVLDLTQIDFGSEVRYRLGEAGDSGGAGRRARALELVQRPGAEGTLLSCDPNKHLHSSGALERA